MYKSWVGSKEESNRLFIWGIFVKLTCWNFQAEHLKWANYQSNTESVWHLDKCSRTEVMLVYSPISPCLVIGLEWILRMSRRACSLGSSMSEEETKGKWFSCVGSHRADREAEQEKFLRILRSSLPGRSRAGSRVSGLLVAMIILTLCNVSKPSIWFNSWKHTDMSCILCD